MTALSLLDKAITLDPKFVDAQFARAVVLYDGLDNLDQSLDAFSKVISLDPSCIILLHISFTVLYTPAYLYRAKIQLYNNNLSGALRDLETVTKQDPSLVEGLLLKVFSTS